MGKRIISLFLPEPRSRKYWMSGWVCSGLLLPADSLGMIERRDRDRESEIEAERKRQR